MKQQAVSAICSQMLIITNSFCKVGKCSIQSHSNNDQICISLSLSILIIIHHQNLYNLKMAQAHVPSLAKASTRLHACFTAASAAAISSHAAPMAGMVVT
jgi:hypothetical protein